MDWPAESTGCLPGNGQSSTFVTAEQVRNEARRAGFALSGIARAEGLLDFARFAAWVGSGYAGEMRYLTDHRCSKRADPHELLASAKSIVCVGMLYNGPEPYSTQFSEPERAWISRYAWGDDYHDIMRDRLQTMIDALLAIEPFDYKICVDTAPLLERSYAREAGLGWIGKNTCLIHEGQGSWFFLGEILTSLNLAPSTPTPERCGTCTRCIDACPTAAIVPQGDWYAVDSRLCISYLTIELRSAMPESLRSGVGAHVFGCDICQDVCPWNRRAPLTAEPSFAPNQFAPPLARLAALSEEEFRAMFRTSPVNRARYTGFLRNVAVAMGNARNTNFREPLERLARFEDPMVAEHAKWALTQM